jgi:GNAT superfamily N-acetyltransferase
MATVRVAREEDAAALVRLLAAFRDWWQRAEPVDEQIERGVRGLLGDRDTEFLLASLEEGGEPLGMAQLRYRYLWADVEECELEGLFVEERMRRAGLGRALVQTSIERARARNCLRLQVNANEADDAPMALYEAYGFSAWYDPPGGRNLNMRLVLQPIRGRGHP